MKEFTIKLTQKQFYILAVVALLTTVIIFGLYMYSDSKNNSTKNPTTLNKIPTVIRDDIVVDTSSFINIAKCANYTGDSEYQICLDKFMNEYSGEKTIKELLAELELNRDDPSIEGGCHPISHAIGRYALTKHGNIGNAFEACDYTCNSGCYHGVMERMFFSEEDLAAGTNHLTYEDMEEKIPGICDEKNFPKPTALIIYQCLHGIGHAVLYSVNYDLDLALKGCDLLENDYEKSSCYGGVFMENITAFDKKKRDLDAEIPAYPCTRMSENYKDECYYLQTSAMFEYLLTFEEIASECQKSGRFASYCFQSYGRDLSSYVRTGALKDVVQACEEFSTGYNTDCIRGVSTVLVDSHSDGKFAFEFCDALNIDLNKRNCFDITTNYMEYSYLTPKSDIKSYCNLYAKNSKQICTNTVD